MKAPVLDEYYFDKYKDTICPKVSSISKLNGKGCRKNFTLKVPPLEDPYNAHLVIHNHKDRWMYCRMAVESIAGNRFRITSNPMAMWSGYVIHNGIIYRVNADELLNGILTESMIIPLSEVES